jgi:hypothetical protein
MHKVIRWNPEKAKQLRQSTTRKGITFEACVIAIEGNGVLDIIKNPNANHPDQLCFVLGIEGYAFLVPFVETEEEVFLKTAMPVRGLTAKYFGRKTQ